MITIYDVAKLAGVSPKTVSRVLNNDAPVKASTRELVEKAIAELGYIPSSAARVLRSQRSGLIGLITGDIQPKTEESDVRGLPDMFLVRGAQEAAIAAGKILMVADTGGNSERAQLLIQKFREYRAEGIIYVSEYHQEIQLPKILQNYAQTQPIVLLNCFDKNNTSNIPSVVPDDENGQYYLVKKLIEQGHRKIAYLTLPDYIVATKLRLKGYQRALADYQIDFNEHLVVTGYTDRTNSITDLWIALEKILNLDNNQRPTVLCCGNDEMAMRIYGMLRTRGIKVPEEMSVAGFDDYTQISETLFPTLSTAELPYPEMGKRAIELLLNLINNKNNKNNKNNQDSNSNHSNKMMVSGKVMWRDSVINIK